MKTGIARPPPEPERDMRILTLVALAALAAGIYHHRQWRAARRRMLLAQPAEEPAVAVVTLESGIATGL
jgi:hypothetical protein